VVEQPVRLQERPGDEAHDQHAQEEREPADDDGGGCQTRTGPVPGCAVAPGALAQGGPDRTQQTPDAADPEPGGGQRQCSTNQA
jgi:hypothetical protein